MSKIFTQIVPAVEGNLDFAGIENPEFSRAYYAVKNSIEDKNREIISTSLIEDATELIGFRTDADLQEKAAQQAEAEGFTIVRKPNQGYPYVDVAASPLGRITQRTVTEAFIRNEAYNVSREEITVELF